MQIQPYLFFEGRCEEAIEFYRRTLGAQTEMVLRFKDNPDPRPGDCSGESGEKIMHASLRVGEATLMLSDGRCQGQPAFQGFSLSLDAKDEAGARRLFEGLGEGGTVIMPLGKTFFSPCFGMVADRFGVSWMIIVPA